MQLPAESRQFDFWVGAWDVNQRVQQEDLSWKDSIKAEARVYPILFGKAVLELWDSPNIKGYSLRYFAYSEVDADALVMTTQADAEGRKFRFGVEQGEGGVVVWTTDINSPDGDAWTKHASARFMKGSADKTD